MPWPLANLVEFECIKQIIEPTVLPVLGQSDIVLLKAVQCELGLVVNEDFHDRLDHRKAGTQSVVFSAATSDKCD